MEKAYSEVRVSSGQRVNFVMADGQFRPMDVVLVRCKENPREDIICGYVLFASGDIENLPEGITANFVTVSFSPHQTVPIPSFVEKVAYDETRTPGTFHFDEEGDAEDGLNMAVLQEQIDDLRKQVKALLRKPKADKDKSNETPPPHEDR